MNKTISGFPKKIKSIDHLLRIIDKRGGNLRYVPAHYNSEKGCGDLHSAMWALEKANLIQLESPLQENNDSLFILKITAEGAARIQNKQYNKFTLWIAILALVISIVALFKN